MTENCSRNITPDSLTGLILGFEGIRNALVILNGPTGCKFYHSITAENQSIRKDDYDPLNYPEEWFFGQRRVPCTYLDKRDYVYGSDRKLTDTIDFILKRITPDVLIVVNSPGAALIGDDLERIVSSAVKARGFTDQNLPVITCQSPGYSRDLTDGYREACRMILERFCAEDNADPNDAASNGKSNGKVYDDRPVVNLLGLSIYQKYHAGDIKEISRLLELCGIQVNTSLLCESTLDEIRKAPDALMNIVVDPDYGLDAAEYMNERFGIPYIVSEYGYPVGFKAMENLLKAVADALAALPEDIRPENVDTAPALRELEKARAQVYVHLARLSSLTGLPKGAPFAVYGTPAQKRGYSAFLREYLGMEDVSGIPEDEAAEYQNNNPDPDIVLADGNTIAMMKAEGKKFSGIEISLPTIGYIDVIEKTHLGAEGGLFLIEQILNSFTY